MDFVLKFILSYYYCCPVSSFSLNNSLLQWEFNLLNLTDILQIPGAFLFLICIAISCLDHFLGTSTLRYVDVKCSFLHWGLLMSSRQQGQYEKSRGLRVGYFGLYPTTWAGHLSVLRLGFHIWEMEIINVHLVGLLWGFGVASLIRLLSTVCGV